MSNGRSEFIKAGRLLAGTLGATSPDAFTEPSLVEAEKLKNALSDYPPWLLFYLYIYYEKYYLVPPKKIDPVSQFVVDIVLGALPGFSPFPKTPSKPKEPPLPDPPQKITGQARQEVKKELVRLIVLVLSGKLGMVPQAKIPGGQWPLRDRDQIRAGLSSSALSAGGYGFTVTAAPGLPKMGKESQRPHSEIDNEATDSRSSSFGDDPNGNWSSNSAF